MKIEQRVRKILEKIKKEDKKINSFLEINPLVIEEAKALDSKKGKKGRLYGKIIGVKSNINVFGLTASCASKTLENYKSGYDATVIEKIKAEDGLIIGMLNCDEFACGSSGESSAFGPTDNPVVPGFVSGGSSSGSAAAVAAGFCDMALGSDTGGSIRVPASFCGVVGIKPSYGAVSRYGLIDLSMSLDQIGSLARSVEEAALLFDVIKGRDSRDTKTFDIGKTEIKKQGKVKVGIVKVNGINEGISKKIEQVLAEKRKSWDFKEIELKHIDLAVQTYHLLLWTEFFSATRRFDGRKYGKKIEDSAGEEVLRRILGGSEIAKAEFSGRYYYKALQVKEIIKQEFENCFTKKGVDCLVMPTVSILPWKLGEKTDPEELYFVDSLVIPGNLAEVCAVSVPVGKIEDSGVMKPVGMQIICAKGEEGKMLSIAKEFDGLG